MHPNKRTIICIKTFSSRAAAEVAKSALKAGGIQSYIMGDDAGGMYPPFLNGIRLYVSRKNLVQAKSIL